MVGHFCDRIKCNKCKLKCTEETFKGILQLGKTKPTWTSKVLSTLRTQRLKTIRPPCKRLTSSSSLLSTQFLFLWIIISFSAQKEGRKMSKEKTNNENWKWLILFIYENENYDGIVDFKKKSSLWRWPKLVLSEIIG